MGHIDVDHIRVGIMGGFIYLIIGRIMFSGQVTLEHGSVVGVPQSNKSAYIDRLGNAQIIGQRGLLLGQVRRHGTELREGLFKGRRIFRRLFGHLEFRRFFPVQLTGAVVAVSGGRQALLAGCEGGDRAGSRVPILAWRPRRHMRGRQCGGHPRHRLQNVTLGRIEGGPVPGQRVML